MTINICLYVELVPAVEVPEEENSLDGKGEGASGEVQMRREGGGWHGRPVEVHQLEDTGEPEEGEHGHVLTVVNLEMVGRRE